MNISEQLNVSAQYKKLSKLGLISELLRKCEEIEYLEKKLTELGYGKMNSTPPQNGDAQDAVS